MTPINPVWFCWIKPWSCIVLSLKFFTTCCRKSLADFATLFAKSSPNPGLRTSICSVECPSSRERYIPVSRLAVSAGAVTWLIRD